MKPDPSFFNNLELGDISLYTFFQLYRQLTPTMQKAIKSMLDVYADKESTVVERDMAYNTIEEIILNKKA